MTQTALLSEPYLPQYRMGALCDVLPAVACAVGASGFTDIFDLPRVRRACVILVDGLGQRMLEQHRDGAPTLAQFTDSQYLLTAGFPSSTSTSITSLSTGLAPGEHGMVGYRMRMPGTDTILHSLRWDREVDPVSWQPHPTIFERLVAQGFSCYHVAAGSFRTGGLTVAAWRGAQYVAAETPGDLIATAATVMQRLDRGVAYVYTADLDRTGHLRGWQSPAWGYQLGIVDTMISQLIKTFPPDTLVLITGDHGMVDTPLNQRINIDVNDPNFNSQAPDAGVAPGSAEVTARLNDGITLFSGEDRVRYLHTRPGAAGDVLATWQEVFANQAWVVSREQAISEGWFGPGVRPEFIERIGDVIVAASRDIAVHASVREPRPGLPVGLHGSLTPEEQLIPLLVTTC